MFIALVLQGEDVFPIPGTKRVKYLEENVKAFFVKLSKEEVDYLSKIFTTEAVLHFLSYALLTASSLNPESRIAHVQTP